MNYLGRDTERLTESWTGADRRPPVRRRVGRCAACFRHLTTNAVVHNGVFYCSPYCANRVPGLYLG